MHLFISCTYSIAIGLRVTFQNYLEQLCFCRGCRGKIPLWNPMATRRIPRKASLFQTIHISAGFAALISGTRGMKHKVRQPRHVQLLECEERPAEAIGARSLTAKDPRGRAYKLPDPTHMADSSVFREAKRRPAILEERPGRSARHGKGGNSYSARSRYLQIETEEPKVAEARARPSPLSAHQLNIKRTFQRTDIQVSSYFSLLHVAFERYSRHVRQG